MIKQFSDMKSLNIVFMFNSLPHNKILDPSNLKDFADYKISVTYATTFVMERVENIEGKRDPFPNDNF